MKLSHLLTTGEKFFDVKGTFEKGVLFTGSPILLFCEKTSGKNKTFAVEASTKDWDRFSKWVGKRATIDISKTHKTYELMNGKMVQGVLVNAEVNITQTKKEEDDESDKE